MNADANYEIKLPASLRSAVEEAARQDGTTVDQFIVTAVAEKLSALKTATYFAERASKADFEEFDRLMSRKREKPLPPGDEFPGP